MPRHRLPALSDLADFDLGGWLQDAIAPERLKELGWAGAGGVAAAVLNRAGTSRVAALGFMPHFLASRPWLINGVLGALGGSAAWTWNETFAKGLVGKAMGDAAEGALAEFGIDLSFGAGAGATAGFGLGAPVDALAPLTQTVTVNPNQLAEVLPQGGIGEVIPRGGLGANVLPISAQPTIQPTFRPQYAGGLAAALLA